MKNNDNPKVLTDVNEQRVRDFLYVKQFKRKGDIADVADVLGISTNNVTNALERMGSKYHDKVVQTLIKIIEHRESLKLELSKANDDNK